METPKKKTVKVSEEIHEALRFIGYKGESYDQIIRRTLEHYAVTWGTIPGIGEDFSEDTQEAPQ